MTVVLKFKGIKNLKVIPELEIPVKPSIKDFWAKLFGHYYPSCPHCGEQMFCQELKLDVPALLQATVPLNQGIHAPSVRMIKITFKCRKCGSTMKGEAKGLQINNDYTFTLDEVLISYINLKA